MSDVRAEEAWTVNLKALFDLALQDWANQLTANQKLREKLESTFFNNQQRVDLIANEAATNAQVVNAAAATSAQINNAVLNAALTRSVLSDPLDQTIEGKLAAQFPASVVEIATAITDKFGGMVSAEAVKIILDALAPEEE